FAQGRLQRSKMMRGDDRIGDDDKALSWLCGKQLGRIAEQSFADVNRIRAIGELDFERRHVSREGPPRPTDQPPGGQRAERAWGDVASYRSLHGSASSQRTNRITPSRSGSIT